MLKTKSRFVEQLRRDKIRAPTVRAFSDEDWTRDYERLGTDTPEECAIFEAGIWVAHELRELWRKVDALELTRFSFDSVVTALMLQSVREYHRQSNPGAIGYPAPLSTDYGYTALGDALWRALTFVASKKGEFREEANISADATAALLRFCSKIYVIEYMMGRVIHCSWQLVHTPDGPIFKPLPRAVTFAENEAIALAARAEEYAEFFLVFSNLWSQGGLRQEAPYQLRLTDRTLSRAKFRLLRRPPKDMPLTIALFEMDIPPWLRPMMATIPNNLDGLSVETLVHGWLLLHTVFHVLYNRETRDGTATWATVSLHEEDLASVFCLFGYPQDAAQTIMTFFTYDWTRHEALWAAPLVKVGKLVYPFLPSLISPNMTRMLDLWLKRCEISSSGGKVDTLVRLRGSVFEEHIRRTLAEYFSRNPQWDARVHSAPIVIRGAEIDLLWRIGSTVFVADAKFMKYPANPNEIGHYYRELEHGAEQASSRVTAVRAESRKVAELLGWTGSADELSYQACVICGHAMGSGVSFGGVPCIQFDMLETYFREGQFVMCGSTDETHNVALPLPKEPDVAAMTCFYIQSPAAIWFRKPAIKTVPVVCCKLKNTEVRFEHRNVDLPLTIEREAYCRELQPKWEALLKQVDASRANL